jgi:hypothetical protein
MEIEMTEKKSPWRIIMIIISALVLVFLIYFAVMAALGPERKLEELRDQFGHKAGSKEKVNEELFSDSTYLAILKEKAFWQSKTIMAQTDSIYLTINLKDSTAGLEISGVVVHSAKISSYKISNLFREGDKNIIYNLLSSPLTIENSISTIKKEPVMIKLAPKDTSEYKPDIMPDTTIIEPVNVILEMNDGIRLFIYQEESDGSSDGNNILNFDFRDRVRNAWSSVKSVISFKVPDYHPFIKIKVPRSDCKIIFRALPRNGQVSIYT